MDLSMPVLEGFGATEQIAAGPGDGYLTKEQIAEAHVDAVLVAGAGAAAAELR
jgi:CheY-like chemotaxis protein